jgi:hypothetical protein
VPKDDRFQMIAEHDVENFVFDLNYLDPPHRGPGDNPDHLERGPDGRAEEARYKAIADGLAAALSLRREDVFIGLVEVRRENWSSGNGVRQYA